jgi:hypothetical protein
LDDDDDNDGGGDGIRLSLSGAVRYEGVDAELVGVHGSFVMV